jgi:hypothetical protein
MYLAVSLRMGTTIGQMVMPGAGKLFQLESCLTVFDSKVSYHPATAFGVLRIVRTAL